MRNLIQQHIATGAQFTDIAGFSQYLRRGIAAPIAKRRKIDFNQRQTIEKGQQQPSVFAGFDADSSGV